MGRVWRAADEMLDRQVAVKEMRIDGLDAEDTRTRRERTLREARATARIDHPNVVRVYDVVDEGERLWIVMELVKGRSLERMTVEDGPLGPRETALLGLGLVRALRQVHARGVLHRDIKPGNVLVESGDRTGHRIVLTDFGIAAMQDAEALTMVGMLVGSPDYMAPERVSGRPQGPPSDIWSLGATLCAALGGRSPFSRDTTLATLHAVLYEEPELPRHSRPVDRHPHGPAGEGPLDTSGPGRGRVVAERGRAPRPHTDSAHGAGVGDGDAGTGTSGGFRAGPGWRRRGFGGAGGGPGPAGRPQGAEWCGRFGSYGWTGYSGRPGDRGLAGRRDSVGAIGTVGAVGCSGGALGYSGGPARRFRGPARRPVVDTAGVAHAGLSGDPGRQGRTGSEGADARGRARGGRGRARRRGAVGCGAGAYGCRGEPSAGGVRARGVRV
ncbi:serine/threonine-protein kinase [Streptomyces sp. SAI-133]|uniref:serine/threonine-protein kinase n=1 Tax=Streptomyces sp. SAI-133 TaxID=2940547 RepID=UPI0024746A1F|nr:serine/threonine-protein kinase [Streptomyces sp. SAI-133]